MNTLVVTGTDTGVGKTIVAAGLTRALGASYWKPVQAGLEETTDSEVVAALTGQPVLPEAYRLNLPASPHLAAEDMGITIDTANLEPPLVQGALIIEGAGGVMVPLDRQTFFLDLFAKWHAPIVLVARTALGTINHTALSINVLRSAGCNLAGVIFNGSPQAKVEQTIEEMCGIRHLGRLDTLDSLNGHTLGQAFANIDVDWLRDAL